MKCSLLDLTHGMISLICECWSLLQPTTIPMTSCQDGHLDGGCLSLQHTRKHLRCKALPFRELLAQHRIIGLNIHNKSGNCQKVVMYVMNMCARKRTLVDGKWARSTQKMNCDSGIQYRRETDTFLIASATRGSTRLVSVESV